MKWITLYKRHPNKGWKWLADRLILVVSAVILSTLISVLLTPEM